MFGTSSNVELLLTLGLIATSLAPAANAHSWNEQLSLVGPDGTFVQNGYPRGYKARYESGYDGNSMMWLLPPAGRGRTRIDNSDFACHTNQRTKKQSSPEYPRLNVTAGSTVAMKYLENGHVTLPFTQAGKQESGGSVFVFGTTKPKDDAKLKDVLQWTADGTGGDKSGRLIAAQNFDDGRCYQLNAASDISKQRMKQFPNPPNKPNPNGDLSLGTELWCETVINLPADIPQGDAAYTVYWVWDWRSLNKTQEMFLPQGQHGDDAAKDEFYTTCSDFNVLAQPQPPAPNAFALKQQDPMNKPPPGGANAKAHIATPGDEPDPKYGPHVGGPAPSQPAAQPPASQPAMQPAQPATPAAPTAKTTPAPTPAAGKPAAGAPSSMSLLGLNAFSPAGPQGAAASSAPAAGSTMVPKPVPSSPAAAAAGSGPSQVLTVPEGAHVFVMPTGGAGSMVQIQKRAAEATPTTMSTATLKHSHSFARRYNETYHGHHYRH